MSQAAFDAGGPSLPGSGVFGLPEDVDAAGVILIPVPWEPTTSYGKGTARGPAAILEASRQVDLFDRETGRPYQRGIVMLPEADEVRGWNDEACAAAEPVIAAAGEVDGHPDLARKLDRVNELSRKLNGWVEREAAQWRSRGRLVGIVGGDHAVPLGAIAAAARQHPGLGILHLDAHADLREAYEGFMYSHASIMNNVLREVPGVGRLVQVGVRDFSEAEADLAASSGGRVVTHFDADLAAARFAGTTWQAQCERIVAGLPAEVYLSYDIDGLDPALCPHTGTPVPGGLSFQEVSHLTGAVVRSGRRIVGFDLVEVAPGPPGDEWDANVGARLLYKMIGWAVSARA